MKNELTKKSKTLKKVKCPKCKGTGKIGKNICSKCKGTGEVELLLD
jgi:uncharacterized phage protein